MNAPLATDKGLVARASGWRLAVIAFIVAVLVLLVSDWQAVASLVWVWLHDGTYQYALLIFPLALWLAWELRGPLRAQAPVPSVWGLAAVAVLVAIAALGRALAVNLPQHFALVALFPALVLACWGWRALRVLAFPLAYLVAFAVPWGDGMVGPLQDITARIAVHALNLTGTLVVLNGREILTPSATWMVADACSGVKFFLACTALGCLYAWLLYQRTWKRIVFVLASAIVPVIANGLRVYFTVLIGETWGIEYATGTDHLIFGWQFFGTVLVLLLVIGWFFRDRVPPRVVYPVDAGKVSVWRGAMWPLALLLLCAGGLLVGAPTTTGATQDLRLSAPTLAGWVGSLATDTAWQPHFAGADGAVLAEYHAATGGAAIGLFHAGYVGRPRRGHELVTYGNNVYDPHRESVLASARLQARFAGGEQFDVRELRLAGDTGYRLLWTWYCVDGRCTASAVVTKLLQAWAVLRGRTPHSSVWALSTPVAGSDLAAGRNALRAFVANLAPVPRESVHGAGS